MFDGFVRLVVVSYVNSAWGSASFFNLWISNRFGKLTITLQGPLFCPSTTHPNIAPMPLTFCSFLFFDIFLFCGFLWDINIAVSSN